MGARLDATCWDRPSRRVVVSLSRSSLTPAEAPEGWETAIAARWQLFSGVCCDLDTLLPRLELRRPRIAAWLRSPAKITQNHDLSLALIEHRPKDRATRLIRVIDR